MTNPEVQSLDYLLIVKILPRKYRLFWQIGCLLLAMQVSAQTPIDTLPLPVGDSIAPIVQDSAVVNLNRLKISNDALDDKVDYNSRDSMWFDVKNKQVHLYGEATVKYTTLTIKAGYILLDYGRNELSAQQFPDSTGQLTGLPDFKDAEQARRGTGLYGDAAAV